MSGIIKGLFGRTSSAERVLQRFQPVGFQAPGLRGSFGGNTFSLRRTDEGTAAIEDLRSGFENRAAQFRSQRPLVEAGSGRLTQAIRGTTRERVSALRRSGSRRVSNLREELGRRRVAGSSFAESQVSAEEAQIRSEEDLIRAEGGQLEAAAFLQEIDLTNQLIQQETQADIGGLEAVLEQLNLETGLAASLSAQVSELMNRNLTAQAEARASQEAGAAEFLGAIIGAFVPV